MAKLSQSMKSATGPGAGAGRREVRSVATVYGVSFHAGTGRGASWRNLAYFEGSRQQPVRFLERIDPDPARRLWSTSAHEDWILRVEAVRSACTLSGRANLPISLISGEWCHVLVAIVMS